MARLRGPEDTSSAIERAFYTAAMASKGLTECWRDAMAAKPSTWRLMGVACGPREADPKVHSAEEWCAWARGRIGSGSRAAAADRMMRCWS